MTNPVDRYLRDAALARRRRAQRAGALLAIGGAAAGALATRATDIGHFTGWVALAASLLISGVAVAIVAR